MKTALVTGASGFIGRKLCERLRADGYRVVAMTGRKSAEGPWDESYPVDLSDDAAVAAISGRFSCDIIFHLAGKAHALAEIGADPADYAKINAAGTRRVLELAKTSGVRRFVFASTIKAMGEGDFEPEDESSPCNPLTAYGRSKLDAEKILFSSGLVPEPVALRLSMVYGGKERGNMTRMVDAVRRHRFPPFPETGNRRSMVHVDDVVEAFMLAATHPNAPGQAFIVTDGRHYSTREIYLIIRKVLGRGAPAFTPPLYVFRFAAKLGDILGAIARRRMPLDSDSLSKLTDSAAYSSRLIRETLGFAPRRTLEDGVRLVVAELEVS